MQHGPSNTLPYQNRLQKHEKYINCKGIKSTHKDLFSMMYLHDKRNLGLDLISGVAHRFRLSQEQG